MENESQKYLKSKGIVPFLSFKDGKSHRIIVVKDKIDAIKDKTGQPKEGISYLVKEDGQPAKFFTSSIGLIQKLSKYVGIETEVDVQMKSVKTDTGYQSRYSVDPVNGKDEPAPDEEIPIVEDQELDESSF